ncbi:MAG: DEAD/DEAH box helicase [Fluviicola sp. XM-24bin1]|nr:MAG: DEAD/DEAH box helicase [Fluviicola sp. XM-24bin1]
MKFNELGLDDSILTALNQKGYTSPTPIQEQSIPIVLEEKDLLGVAQTGTGKTAAFAIPIIQLLNRSGTPRGKRPIRSLIVTPTRELAIQIEENIKAYAKFTDLRHAVIFGGVKQHSQVVQLKGGVDILVATPGRLLDLMQQGYISLKQVEIFVLDEADRMLDMGFIHDIRKLLEVLPKRRQSLFFSATMPDNIVQLSRKILYKPQKVEVTPESTTAETVKQLVYFTNRADKKKLIMYILKDPKKDQVLVFSRTKHGADRLARDLSRKKINAAAIHGDKAQNQRQRSLKNFKTKELRVLVATDIAARGIDIDKLNWVINFDIPNVPETYVHRIGRVGRAGETGTAISIAEPEENAFVKDIEKLIKQPIEVISEHPFPQTEKPMTKEEKKQWEKEKQKRKQEFFANRKKKQQGGGQSKRKPKGQGRQR